MYDIKLNNETIEMYMMKTYQNNQCTSVDEYLNDLKRIKYIKRLLNRYEKTGELKERLLLNHIIVVYNLFGKHATTILFYYVKEESWSALKTFLVFLNVMPENVYDINGATILDSDIAINFDIANRLRKI